MSHPGLRNGMPIRIILALLGKSSLETCNNYSFLRRQTESGSKLEDHVSTPTYAIVTSPTVSEDVPIAIYKFASRSIYYRASGV